ncbi:MAG: DUF4235 domain-containing protein [Bifidobacteriaceae bacterium]|jgi:hypothetical protein|nr:DUF4235 domain-containing protein [Bifidobacteriaceae bacterium]
MKLAKWLYTTLATMAAGFVAAEVVKLVWRVVSGEKAPTDADDPATSTLQAAAFAALVAAAVAIAQTLAGRGAAKLGSGPDQQ